MTGGQLRREASHGGTWYSNNRKPCRSSQTCHLPPSLSRSLSLSRSVGLYMHRETERAVDAQRCPSAPFVCSLRILVETERVRLLSVCSGVEEKMPPFGPLHQGVLFHSGKPVFVCCRSVTSSLSVFLSGSSPSRLRRCSHKPAHFYLSSYLALPLYFSRPICLSPRLCTYTSMPVVSGACGALQTRGGVWLPNVSVCVSWASVGVRMRAVSSTLSPSLPGEVVGGSARSVEFRVRHLSLFVFPSFVFL